jgi:diaminohydroxyphosphoribosylaminopyrimidine deaminase / 5-amino-6-(5-phosphoribosylamino)uracil reductase
MAEQGAADALYMRRALELATRGWGRVHPNPMVGAVVVRDGEVVGEGYHREYGHPHAEVEALDQAGARARGATIYVTLEPCSHYGKTPPCTEAVLAAGIRRLVYACPDPNPKAAGGAAVLSGSEIEIVGGVLEDEARDLNAAFLHRFSSAGAERPWIELKLALSLDARVADHQGRSVWITGESARAEVHRMRAGFDGIAVGIGTALSDEPLLTVRGEVQPRVPPVRIVFDRMLRLPVQSRLVRTAADVPVWAVADDGAPAERAAQLEAFGVRVLRAQSLRSGLAALRAAGIRSIFAEGGAAMSSAFLAEGVVDRLHLFYAPLWLGPQALSPFDALASPPIADATRWRCVRSARFDQDTLITLAP